MIIEFAATNFRSIKTRQVLDLRAVGQVSLKEMPDNLIYPRLKSHGGALLRTAMLYGANASGKSNLLKAIWALESMVLKSNEYKLDKPIPTYEPYKLDRVNRNQPTVFEVDFVAKNEVRYNYLVTFDRNRIIREELYNYQLGREVNRPTKLFVRSDKNTVEFGESYRGKRDFTLLDNQLLLSKAGTDAIPLLMEAYRFFSTYLFSAVAQSTRFDQSMLKMIEHLFSNEGDKAYQRAVISMMKAADIGISHIFAQEYGDEKFRFPEDLPEEERQKLVDKFRWRIKTVHPLLEKGAQVGEEVFDLSEESLGTMKFLGMAGYIVDALDDGSVVIIDELDKSLHPLLTRVIINLFQNPTSNPNNAQLIFTTHDVTLMDKELFRRDQIFLLDKNIEGYSEIRQLSDITGISKIKTWQKWYLSGMFGGVPSINEYEINLKLETPKPSHV